MDILDETGGRGRPVNLTREQVQIRNAGIAQAWSGGVLSGSPHCAVRISWRCTGDHGAFRHTQQSAWQVEDLLRDGWKSRAGGVHRGAPRERLAALMEEYVRFVNHPRQMEAHPVIRALLAHFFLVTVHPFGDGNGRVSRLVEAGVLFQQGYNVHGFYGLSNYFYRNEREYKMRLQKCRELHRSDVTPFVQFGIEGFATELKE